MIREAAQYQMNFFRMKCVPISNTIQLWHYCRVPSSSFFMWLWGGDKEMKGEINHLLQHKAQVISWKWTCTVVWYMGSPLPCNGNLSVLYDFIQNPSSLCGATKHIKAKWRMVPVSVRKTDEGYNILHPQGWGMGRFLLIIVKGICPAAYCSGPLDEHCLVCMHVHVCVCVRAQVSHCGMPVLH